MANTLLEQLRKTGLVDDKKARQAGKDKHRQAKRRQGKKAQPEDESKRRARQAQAEKVARDRELDRRRKQAAEQNAIAAQVRQLIEMNRIEPDGGTVGFHFTDGGKLRRIYLTESLQGQLARGLLAIVRLGNAYELVPAGVAERIGQRDPGAVICHHEAGGEGADADDPYADYPVPDDLMW